MMARILPQLTGRLEAVVLGHREVHQDNVGWPRAPEVNRFDTAKHRTAFDRFCAQVGCHRKRRILIIVDNEHTQGGAIECGAAVGSRAGSPAKKS